MNLIKHISILCLFFVLLIKSTRSTLLSNQIDKILKTSRGEVLVGELRSFGLPEDQLNDIVRHCSDGSDDTLACLIINVYKAILMKKHNFEVCLSSYVLYTGVTCMDSCIKNYQIQCLECLGENIPFISDCLANGHIDYRPEYLSIF